MGWTLSWVEWDPRAQPEVALILPHGHTTESTQDQVVVSVVPGVMDGHILEHIVFCPKYVVCPGPHLLNMEEHAPCMDVPSPWYLTRDEVSDHELHTFHFRCCSY